jgi:hypothetical protein
MDVVVAQGLLAAPCLLQLSTASRGAMTKAARHKAMKEKMLQNRLCRGLKDIGVQERFRRVGNSLAALQFGDNVTDRSRTIIQALDLCAGRLVPMNEMIEMSNAHLQDVRDLDPNEFEFPATTSEEEMDAETSEEETLAEDPVIATPVRLDVETSDEETLADLLLRTRLRVSEAPVEAERQ